MEVDVRAETAAGGEDVLAAEAPTTSVTTGAAAADEVRDSHIHVQCRGTGGIACRPLHVQEGAATYSTVLCGARITTPKVCSSLSRVSQWLCRTAGNPQPYSVPGKDSTTPSDRCTCSVCHPPKTCLLPPPPHPPLSRVRHMPSCHPSSCCHTSQLPHSQPPAVATPTPIHPPAVAEVPS
jgi:hypothetical protein